MFRVFKRLGLVKKTIVFVALVCYVLACYAVVPSIPLPESKAFQLVPCDQSEIPENYYNMEVPHISHEMMELFDLSEIPNNYYDADVPHPSHSLMELLYFISEIKYPHAYEEHVFDCSESAAFLEWYLENHGYDAVIVVGTNENQNVHAWVRVKNLTNASGCAATIDIDRHKDSTYFALPGFSFNADKTHYDDIFAACKAYGQCSEWNWW